MSEGNKGKLDKETNSKAFRKIYRGVVAQKEGKCSICPMHAGENRRRRPRPDKYKNKRTK